MVFTRPEAFDQNYIPEEYLYRMREMQEIARCLTGTEDSTSKSMESLPPAKRRL